MRQRQPRSKHELPNKTITHAQPEAGRSALSLFWGLAALTAALTAALACARCAPLPRLSSAAQDVKPAQLHSCWAVPLGDSALIWTLHPGPHPQHRGSSRGELVRDALRLPVVADWEHGEFSMRARSLPEMAQI